MIDLAEYSPGIMNYIRARKLCCVYVFAHDGQAPCKIGHGRELFRRFSETSLANATRITVEHAWWTPGTIVAMRLKYDVQELFEKERLLWDWYNADPAQIAEFVRVVIEKNFSHTKILEHQAIMGLSAIKALQVKRGVA